MNIDGFWFLIGCHALDSALYEQEGLELENSVLEELENRLVQFYMGNKELVQQIFLTNPHFSYMDIRFERLGKEKLK